MVEIPQDWVNEAVGGDRRALRRLVDTLTPVIQARVARILLRRSGAGGRDPRQEVRDFVQQILVGLFEDDARTLRQWDPARGRSLTSFVSLIAERETISILRGRAQNPWMKEELGGPELDAADEEEAGPERVTASREELSVILAAVRARLGERGMEIFHLLLVEERPAEEVGEVMGMSRDAVYAWQARLRRMVREIVEGVALDPALPQRNAGERPP